MVMFPAFQRPPTETTWWSPSGTRGVKVLSRVGDLSKKYPPESQKVSVQRYSAPARRTQEFFHSSRTFVSFRAAVGCFIRTVAVFTSFQFVHCPPISQSHRSEGLKA